MSLSIIATLLSVVTLGLLVTLMLQMRSQQLATETLIQDSQIRGQLVHSADDSTSFILSRTIQNISKGHPDPNLESDSFTLKVVRELVKRNLPEERWLEILNNERLVYELQQQLSGDEAHSDVA